MISPDRSEAEGSSGTCVLRPCRIYNLWPEHKVFKSRDMNIPYLGNDTPHISLYIQTFANRPDFSVPAQSLPDELGYSHMRLTDDIGFWLGNVVVGESEEGGSTVKSGSPVGRVEGIARYQGEVDVGIMFPYGQTSTELPVSIVAHMLDIAIPFLATSLGEYFVPITAIQIAEWRGSDRKLSSPQTIRLEGKTRITVSMTQLEETFDRYCALVANSSIEELRGLAVASRRMSSAMLEEDIIDKYCDFWECCEFLSPAGKKVNGVKLPKAKDAAITELLCNYAHPSKLSRQRLRKKIHDGYVIRNDLIHNAVENPEKVDQNMKLIGEIASQLFRYRVGIPFEATPELASLL
jgi:hypothetical protein